MNNKNKIGAWFKHGAGKLLTRGIGLAIAVAISALAAHFLNIGNWAFLALIIVSIFAHELGHWFFARLFGVDVSIFSVGFFKPSMKFMKLWGTEFRITPWFILGGFVKIDPNDDQFRRTAAWKRVIILVAGVAMNGILAMGFLTIGFAVAGKPAGTVRIVQLSGTQSPAAVAGIKVGDVITAIDGISVHTRRDVINGIVINHSDGSALKITVRDELEEKTLSLTTNEGRIGVGLEEDKRFEKVGLANAVELSALEVKSMVSQTITGLGMYTGIVKAPKDLRLHGMIAVTQVGGVLYEQGLFDFMWLIAVVNISLLVMNLLPLPVLDGGHLFNIGYEKVLGKLPSARVQNILTNLCLVLMGAIMALSVFNDLLHPVG